MADPTDNIWKASPVNSDSVIDRVVSMLAHLICADAVDRWGEWSKPVRPNGRLKHDGVDAGVGLRFEPLKPSVAYTTDATDEERLFTTDPRLLLDSPQDLIGRHAEVAFVGPDFVRWAAFKKLHKRPNKVWVSSAGADLYEYHLREIYADGSSVYFKRVAAIGKTGRPVNCIIEGTRDQGSTPDGQYLILAASVIEDAHRPDTFLATVRDDTGVMLPVAQGAHLDVFRLRDGPMSGGRRRALLHWVAAHTRRRGACEFPVKEHLRGIHEFTIEGLAVKLEAA